MGSSTHAYAGFLLTEEHLKKATIFSKDDLEELFDYELAGMVAEHVGATFATIGGL